ncbi:hypothetical protein LCGC14_2661330 [marine sediment metagenome]|uniref:Calcineurin-like phosphoesterase domain-containing protein n=1 Tax=marine sediment metagenome TaxID=412755 RepID=A0A0F8ZRV3_9ZZZZ
MEAVSVSAKTRPSIIYADRDEHLLIPLGDIQLDPVISGRPRAAHVRRLKEVVQWGMDHGASFIGMGDYIDPMSPSNRKAYRAANFYDSTTAMFERGALELQEELHDILAPTVGSWVGLGSGHHLFEFDDGTTTDTRLAEYLGCRHTGDLGITHIYLPAKGTHKRPMYKVYSWHGQGGGVTVAAALNKLQRKVGEFEADVYLMGHYHRAEAVKVPRLDTIGGERGADPHVVHRDRILGVTGSFMRAYLQGSRQGGIAAGGYVEVAGLSPAALGSLVIMARPRYDNNYVTVDLDFMSL